MPNSIAVGVAYADPQFQSIDVTGAATFATVAASTGVSAGAASSPIVASSARSVNQFYVTASHASGDMRAVYARINFTGAGAGETLRAFSTVAAAQGAGQTTNGAHISLSVNTGGSISGAANAARFTLGSAVNSPGGTLAAIQVDTDFAAGVTLPGTASWIRFTESSNAKMTNLFNVPAAMVVAGAAADGTHKIKIVDSAGTAYYLMATTVAP